MALKRSKSESDVGGAKRIKSQEQSHVSPKAASGKTVKTKFGKKSTPARKKDAIIKAVLKADGFMQSDKKKPTGIKKKNGLIKKKGKNTFTEFPKKLIGKDGKPKWNIVKIEKKKLKESRKVHRTGEEQYQMSVKAKSIWEQLRIRKHSAEKKESLVNDLFMLLKGQIPNVIHSHDMARVVQWMLKLGSASVKTAICEELCANTVGYLQSKYASHCIKRALRYGSKSDRSNLIQSCKGHFHKLLAHTFGHPVVETMYTKFASSDQRKQMHRELYGEMSALISPDITSIEKIPNDLRPAILAATKINLTKLLSKKELLKSTLLQSVLNDFMSSCSEQDRVEISELIQGDILELNNSKEGCRVALLVIWSASNKVKKMIVKSIKGKIKEIATSEVGYILLMALFDSIDDTVLVKKALIPELVKEAKEMVSNEYGRKVILYLVAHRDPAFFHPKQMETLSKGDAISKRKKDTAKREQEMLEAISGPLLQKIAEDPSFWFGESSITMVSLAIMKTGKGDPLKQVFEKLVDYILDPSSVIKTNTRQVHVIEDSACHLVLKKLIQLDQTADRSETFSSILVSNLNEESLNQILQFNRGCFLLVLLFESENPKVCKDLKSKVTEPLRALLKKQETTGAKILLKKLSSVK